VAIQSAAGTALDPIFRCITFLGYRYAFLLLLPCLYWCVGKRRALHIALVLLLSAYLNEALKHIFQIPRPFVLSSAVQAKVTATGYAFPSGHAQIAATIWPWMARTFRKRWMTPLAVALVLLISFSRAYLGVHYPQDIIAGMGVGLILVGLFSWLLPHLEAWSARSSFGLQLASALLLPVVLVALLPTEDTLRIAPALAGLGAGYLLERRWIDFGNGPSLGQAAGRMAVGLALLAGVFFGLKAALPSDGVQTWVSTSRALRYALVGLTATLLAPWLFVRLNLARAGAACPEAPSQASEP